jgi:hypothetical protein
MHLVFKNPKPNEKSNGYKPLPLSLLARCPPEHDAVHSDGSLPVLQSGLSRQVHKLLWADHMLVILEGGTAVQGQLSQTQVWWSSSMPSSPLLPEPAPGVCCRDETHSMALQVAGRTAERSGITTQCRQVTSGNWLST